MNLGSNLQPTSNLKLLQQQLKSVISTLSEDDLLKLFNTFLIVTSLKVEKNCKMISYKCYESTYNCNNKKANGYGRNEKEASLNCIRNLLEFLLEDEKVVSIFNECLKRIQVNCDTTHKGGNKLTNNYIGIQSSEVVQQQQSQQQQMALQQQQQYNKYTNYHSNVKISSSPCDIEINNKQNQQNLLVQQQQLQVNFPQQQQQQLVSTNSREGLLKQKKNDLEKSNSNSNQTSIFNFQSTNDLENKEQTFPTSQNSLGKLQQLFDEKMKNKHVRAKSISSNSNLNAQPNTSNTPYLQQKNQQLEDELRRTQIYVEHLERKIKLVIDENKILKSLLLESRKSSQEGGSSHFLQMLQQQQQLLKQQQEIVQKENLSPPSSLLFTNQINLEDQKAPALNTSQDYSVLNKSCKNIVLNNSTNNTQISSTQIFAPTVSSIQPVAAINPLQNPYSTKIEISSKFPINEKVSFEMYVKEKQHQLQQQQQQQQKQITNDQGDTEILARRQSINQNDKFQTQQLQLQTQPIFGCNKSLIQEDPESKNQELNQLRNKDQFSKDLDQISGILQEKVNPKILQDKASQMNIQQNMIEVLHNAKKELENEKKRSLSMDINAISNASKKNQQENHQQIENKLDSSMIDYSYQQSLQKKSIPRLNLTILPNYHGKSNGKSMNQYMLAKYHQNHKHDPNASIIQNLANQKFVDDEEVPESKVNDE